MPFCSPVESYRARLRSGESERPELVDPTELEGVLAEISFEIRATSWSSSEIIGDAGDVIDNVVLISSAWYFMSTSVPEKVTLVQNTVGDVTSWAPVKSTSDQPFPITNTHGLRKQYRCQERHN